MNLAGDLLEQAAHLVRRERRRPKQASLRRAVSSAYYALFHLLAAETAALVGRGLSSDDLRARTARVLEHGNMQRACRAFSTNLPPGLAAQISPSSDLQLVADVFVAAQQQRHRADYDTSARFERAEVEAQISDIADAFEAWKRIKNSLEARYFLMALLFYRIERWRE